MTNPLDRLNDLAKRRGGKCLSTEYLGNHVHHSWQCDKGHVWKTTPGVIQQGSWCAQCNGRSLISIEVIHDFAKEAKITCLSSTYKKVDQKLNWHCPSEHSWSASFAQMKAL